MPERRQIAYTDPYADVYRCTAGPGTDGWYQLLPKMFTVLVK